MSALSLPLDSPVPPNGYAWWYLDGLSDDGTSGFTAILFVGSVFSLRYRRARTTGAHVDPLDHCAVNFCLYGKKRAWVMSEYPRAAVRRSPSELRIGATALRWMGEHWLLDLDERTAPFRRRIQGQVRLTPTRVRDEALTLESAGAHRWFPMSPCARFDIELVQPAVRFSGTAYQDANCGAEGLEHAFHGWTWCRGALAGDGRAGTAVLYDVERRREAPLSIGRLFRPDGSSEPLAAPARQPLPKGRYGVRRHTRCDSGGHVRFRHSYEDTPFYTRALIETQLGGATLSAVHEQTDIDRLQARWVQFLLPFKMRTVR